MTRIRTRLTFANAVSLTALFVALGGGAYAVSTAEKNSVVSKSIKNGQVKNKDLAADAVDGSKVVDGSLGGGDVDESTLGQVSSAATANRATSADSATHADSAAHADSATNADHAATADTAATADHATGADDADHATAADTAASATTAGNGARTFDFDHPATDPSPVPILTIGEMTLLARCYNAAPPVLDLSVRSTTNAEISSGVIEALDATTPVTRAESINLIPNSPEIFVQIAANGGGATSNRRAEGQLVYRNAGRVITATFHANAHNDMGTPANRRCQVWGTALSATG